MTGSVAVELAAVWFTDGLLAEAGDDLSQLALDRIRREIESGDTDLAGAVGALGATRRPRPGEFGLEMVGPAILATLLPLVYRFVERYGQKLVEGTADHAAGLTLDRLKKILRQDALERPERMAEEFEAALAEHGQAAGIDPESARRFLDLVRDREKLAATTSD